MRLSRSRRAVASVVAALIIIILLSTFTASLILITELQNRSFPETAETIETVSQLAKENLQAYLDMETGETVHIRTKNTGMVTAEVKKVLATRSDGSLQTVTLDPPETLMPLERRVFPATIPGGYLRLGLLTERGKVYPVNLFDFSVSVDPESGSVEQGGSVEATVTVTLFKEPSELVTLSISGLPEGATYSFNPLSGNPTFSSTLTISTSPSTSTGSYTLTITGTSEGGLSRTTTYFLIVNSSADFSVSIDPTSGTVEKGSSISATVTVSLLEGSIETVTLSASGVPENVAVSFAPISGTPTFASTLTFSVASNAPAGTYTITISGTEKDVTKSTTYTLTIVGPFDFSLSVNPAEGAVEQGKSATAAVTATLLDGIAKPVSLSASGLPTGASVAFAPVSGNPTFAGTMTITVASSTPIGAYTITIKGTGGGLTKTTAFTLTVVEPFDFSMSVDPNSGSVEQGESIAATVTVTRSSGASSPVSLSALGMPSGASVSFDPSSGNPSFTSMMTITAGSSTPVGTSTITITAARGDQTRTTTYTLTVTKPFDFSISLNPSSGSVAKGGTIEATVTVTHLEGPSKLVSLSASGLPSGASLNFNPSSSYPTFPSTMTITTSSTTPVGTYIITIIGTGGGLTRTATYTLTVYQFDFSVSVNPNSGTIEAGESVQASVTVTLTSGASNPVTLSISGLPSGASASFNPSSGNPTFISFLIISTSKTDTPSGTYIITIVAAGGGLTRTATYTLTVTAPFDFSVSADPASGSAEQGSSASTTVTVTLVSGPTKSVSLSALGLPTDTSASFSPSSGNPSFTSTVTISPGPSTPTGTYEITITGSSNGLTRSTTYTLTVTKPFDYSVSVNPTSGTVTKGGSVSATVTVTLVDGPSKSVSLAVTGLPSGASASFDPSSGNPTCTSTLTISTSSSTPSGTYTVTIKGIGGGLTRTTTFTLIVDEPFDFSISVNPSSGTVIVGSGMTTVVKVTLISGSAKSVSLSASGLPSDSSASYNPSSGNPTFSSTLTISTSSSTPTGTYTITITGSGGGVSHSTTYSLTVSYATITFSEDSVYHLQTGIGLKWSVTFNSETKTADAGQSITFTGIKAGSYSWSVSPPVTVSSEKRYTAEPQSGTMDVPSQTSQVIKFYDEYKMIVSATPPDAGTVDPPVGEHWYRWGTSVTISTSPSPPTDTVSVSGMPTGVSVSWDKTSGTPDFTCTLTINVGSSVTPGSYTLTFTTKKSGYIYICVQGSAYSKPPIELVVKNPYAVEAVHAVKIYPESSSVEIAQGESGSVEVYIKERVDKTDDVSSLTLVVKKKYLARVYANDVEGYAVTGTSISFAGQSKSTNAEGYADFYVVAGSYTLTAPSSATIEVWDSQRHYVDSCPFNKWLDDASASRSRTVTISGDATYTAQYRLKLHFYPGYYYGYESMWWPPGQLHYFFKSIKLSHGIDGGQIESTRGTRIPETTVTAYFDITTVLERFTRSGTATTDNDGYFSVDLYAYDALTNLNKVWATASKSGYEDGSWSST